MQVIIMTSDNQYHCLDPFFYLWQKYYPDPVKFVICGFTPIDNWLADKFYSVGKFADYPPRRWSDALIKVLDEVADDVFTLMLEDYWLIRPVNADAVRMIYDYMHQFQNVLKFDLGYERLYSGTPPEGYNRFYWGYGDYNNLDYLDLIQSDPYSQYHMSLWGGMWRRDLLRQVLVPGESAQEIEMRGGNRLLDHPEWLVLGTRQAPLRHINAIQRGEWNPHDRSGLPGMKQSDLNELRQLGYLQNYSPNET